MIFWVIYFIGVVVCYTIMKDFKDDAVHGILEKHSVNKSEVEKAWRVLFLFLCLFSWIGVLILLNKKK